MADETPPLDDARLAETRRLVDAATPGAWVAESSWAREAQPADWRVALVKPEVHPVTGRIMRRYIAGANLRKQDAEFIAQSRGDVTALLAEVDRLRVEHDEAWDLIDRLAEDLVDHAPLAHDWLIDEANAWREKHPKTKRQ